MMRTHKIAKNPATPNRVLLLPPPRLSGMSQDPHEDYDEDEYNVGGVATAPTYNTRRQRVGTQKSRKDTGRAFSPPVVRQALLSFLFLSTRGPGIGLTERHNKVYLRVRR